MTEVRKKIIYQALYQIIIALTPLITSPYISRVLGVENLGIYSYTYANVSYFMLFAMLGIMNYGSREIAISRIQGKESINRTFSAIFFIQVIMTGVMLCLYILYVVFIIKENKIIALIQIINIVSCLFDINWLFVGIERIKELALRGIVVKILTVFNILFFVKSVDDLWIYVTIMSLSALINNLVIWKFFLTDMRLTKPIVINVFSHIKPCIILFLPVLSSSVYRIMDKTMLGRLSSYDQLGYYYNADKVINIPICLFSGIATILLPRMTYYIHQNEVEKFNFLFAQTIDIFIGSACAICFGIASVAKEFVPLFFGNNYDECVSLVIFFSPVFILKAVSICIRNMYLIPGKKEMIYNLAILGGVFTNLFLNILWIPSFGAKGAVMSTMMTELVVCIIHILGIRTPLRREIFRKQLVVYFINALIMCIVLYFIKYLQCADIYKLIIKIFLGGVIYAGLCLFEWKKIYDIIFSKYIEFVSSYLENIKRRY